MLLTSGSKMRERREGGQTEGEWENHFRRKNHFREKVTKKPFFFLFSFF